jgi:hypothetical protein
LDQDPPHLIDESTTSGSIHLVPALSTIVNNNEAATHREIYLAGSEEHREDQVADLKDIQAHEASNFETRCESGVEVDSSGRCFHYPTTPQQTSPNYRKEERAPLPL